MQEAVERTSREHNNEHLHQALNLALNLNIPIVATNDVQFIEKADFDAHEARICIFDGTLIDDTNRAKKFSTEQYLKSDKEMQELFADIPEAIENTLQIAKRCNVHFKLFDKIYFLFFKNSVAQGHKELRIQLIILSTRKVSLEVLF